jgi:hypothetical protein
MTPPTFVEDRRKPGDGSADTASSEAASTRASKHGAPESRPAPPGAWLRHYLYRGRRLHRSVGVSRHGTTTALVAFGAVFAVTFAATLATWPGSPFDDQSFSHADELVTWPPAADTGSTPTPPSSVPAGLGVEREANLPATSTTAPEGPTATPRPPGAPVRRQFEAEEARLFGTARVIRVGQASGRRVVGNLGTRKDRRKTSAGVIRFVDVTVPAAGRYTLVLDFLTATRRSADLQVNDGRAQSLEFKASRGDAVGQITVSVDLVAGSNALTLGNPSGRGPLLDRITVHS